MDGARYLGRTVDGLLDLPGDDLDLSLSLRLSRGEGTAFPDDSGGPRFAARRGLDRREVDELALGVDLTQVLSPAWSYRLALGLHRRAEEFASPGVASGVRDPFGIPPNTADSNLLRGNAQLAATFEPRPWFSLVAGGSLQREDGRSDGVLVFGPARVPFRFALERDTLAPFGEARLRLGDRLSLTAGLRLDLPEEFDAELSPRAGLVYRLPASEASLRASYSQGFKLPSFFALGHPIVGNPGLRPERAETVELGIA